jgi:hypothetical protein
MLRWALKLLTGVCLVVPLPSAGAQERPAALEREPASPGPGIQFAYRASRPGDQALHLLESSFDLETSIHQRGQTASRRTESIRRQQRYHVVLLQPAGGESARAKLVYLAAREDRRESDSAAVESSSLPVEGHTYLVCRVGEQLAVYDVRGQMAPAEETRWVERTLRSLGTRNPLGAFLDGRRIPVGQRLALPAELARDIWNFGDELGAADQCELVLREVVERPGGTCGRFDIAVRAAQGHSRLDLEGQLLVQASTCRTLESSLSGSFASSSRRGPAGWEFALDRSGTLEMRARAEPADAEEAARVE